MAVLGLLNFTVSRNISTSAATHIHQLFKEASF
jgi:hypothetical protein